MSQYKIFDKEDLLQCPFDNTHMIRASRMQYHLVQCKKNHPKENWSVCPLNARHYVLKHELEHHKKHCPDRAIIERDFSHSEQAQDGSYFSGNCSVPDYQPYTIESDENWDEECHPDPGVYIFGKTSATEYFNRHQERAMERDAMELPQRLPRCLPETAMLPPCLPRGLPNTATPSAVGRGRGVNTLQYQPAQPTPQVGMAAGGNQPPKGRSRGIKSNMTANGNTMQPATNNMLTNGYTVADVDSNSSTGSCQSFTSRGALAQRGRRVNATAVGFNPTINQSVIRQPHDHYLTNQVTGKSESQSDSSIADDQLGNPGPSRKPVETPSAMASKIAKPAFNSTGAPPFLAIGRGRGILSTQMNQRQFVVPNVGNANCNSNTNDVKKQIRRCEKKIRDITVLEEKVSNGEQLDKDQLVKINMKAEVLDMLNKLRLDDENGSS